VAIECERWQWRELFASEHGPVDPSTRLVLFVLALHMNPQGENAFPSQETIAKRTGLSARSVRTHLDRAAKAGWLRIYRKARKGQAWFVSQYVATIPEKLTGLCTSKPWEHDPSWRRAANSAGRPRSVPSDYQHPANGAERAAIDDTTPGKICRDARKELPTNSPSNSSSNTSCEGAVASYNTTDSHATKTPAVDALRAARARRKAIAAEMGP
jgi:Helix-turn-helix domain